MAFGMFTAISGLAEILCQTFLDVIPNLMDQGETCSHVSIFSLLYPGPYFGMGISAAVIAVFTYYLPEPLTFHLPSTIEDTLWMQRSKERVYLIPSSKAKI